MKKASMAILLGLLALTLALGALAQEAATPAAVTEAPAVTEEPAITDAEWETLLATTLESGKTFGQSLEEIGALEAFKAALPREMVRIVRAQVLLGKLTQADAQAVAEALYTALGLDVNQGLIRGGRNDFRNEFGLGQNGGRTPFGRGMMPGRGMMGGMMGGGRNWNGNEICPCPNCQNAVTQDGTVPEVTPVP